MIELNSNNIPMIAGISHVIIFPTAEQAEWYLDNCYDYWPKLVVMSADGKYPTHQKLNAAAHNAWERDTKLSIFVMGWHLLDSMPEPATSRVFTLDQLFVDSCRRHNASIFNDIINKEFTPISLARTIRALMETSTSKGSAIGVQQVKPEMYNWRRMPPWIYDLIS